MITVCLHGPESTGKTTLAVELAAHFGTVAIPEFGRHYCEVFGNACDVQDLRAIRQGHDILVAAGRRKANKLLILDTDAVMTAIWADILLGKRPADLDSIGSIADLYLLCDIDVPFEKDAIRYFPELSARANQFTRAKSELERRRLAFVVMSGTREARLTLAIRSITDRFPELSSA